MVHICRVHSLRELDSAVANDKPLILVHEEDVSKDADGYGIPTDCGAILCDKYEVDDDDNDDNLGP